MAFGSVLESAFLTVGNDFEFIEEAGGGTAVVLQLNPRETGTLVFNVDAPGTTDDLEIEILQGHRVAAGFGIDAAAAGTIDLNTTSDPIAADGDEDGTYIIMTSGDEAGEGRLITASLNADDRVTLSHNLSGVPTASETYDRYRFSPFRFTMDPQTSIGSDAQNNDGISVSAVNGEFVAVVARRTGTTDAHRVKMSYQVDGVSV